MTDQLPDRIKDGIRDYIKANIDIETPRVTQTALKKEGTDNIDDYVQSIGSDFSARTGVPLQQAMASANYFPIKYDPKIYDQGTLYGYTPYMTFMEQRGRRFPTGHKTVQYIKYDTGFIPEWITETGTTSGDGAAVTSTATASIKYLAVPISMSDLIGMGASGTSRSQLLNFAQMALREEFNQTLVAGDSSGTQEFDGIDEIVEDNGTRVNYSAAELTIENMDTLDATMSDTLKKPSTFVLTGAFVLNQIKKDMYSIQRNVERANVGVGINPVAFMNSRGMDIPIIVDPNVPKTASNRRVNFLNDQDIFIEDFLTPVMIPKGSKTGPFVSDFWMAQIAVQYHVAPSRTVQGYGIA